MRYDKLIINYEYKEGVFGCDAKTGQITINLSTNTKVINYLQESIYNRLVAYIDWDDYQDKREHILRVMLARQEFERSLSDKDILMIKNIKIKRDYNLYPGWGISCILKGENSEMPVNRNLYPSWL